MNQHRKRRHERLPNEEAEKDFHCRLTDSVYLPSREAGVARGGEPRQINRVELNHTPGLAWWGCGDEPRGIGSPRPVLTAIMVWRVQA
jgi:hypothetical protein